jgi:hypothetical protein
MRAGRFAVFDVRLRRTEALCFVLVEHLVQR